MWLSGCDSRRDTTRNKTKRENVARTVIHWIHKEEPMRESDIVVLVLGIPLFVFVTFGMSGDLWTGIWSGFFKKKKD